MSTEPDPNTTSSPMQPARKKLDPIVPAPGGDPESLGVQSYTEGVSQDEEGWFEPDEDGVPGS